MSLSMSSILRGSEDCLIWKGENHGIFEGYHNLGDHLLCCSVDSLEFKKQCHIQKFRIEGLGVRRCMKKQEKEKALDFHRDKI
ncbi:unnamed protein product [Camellia sinensis]